MGACSPIPVYSFTMVGKMLVLFLTKQGFTRVADEPVSTSAGQHVPPVVQQSPTQVQPGAQGIQAHCPHHLLVVTP